MSVGTERRPPPPASRPPPPPPDEASADISSSDYRERLRSKSRARTNPGGSSEVELKKNPNNLSRPSNDPLSLSSSAHSSSNRGGKPPSRPNKVKLLQPPDGLTLMDLDNDLLKRRFKNRAEKFYCPIVLLTDGLYTTSSTKFALVEDKAQEIGLLLHVNVQEENDPDSNLSTFCERLRLTPGEFDINSVCARVHNNSIKPREPTRRATLIRYDAKSSEDTVAILAGAYLIKHSNYSVEEAYSLLKSKLLSSRKDKFNSNVYLKLLEVQDSGASQGHHLKNNFISMSLNWIPLLIIGLVAAVYFKGILKLAYALVF